MKRTIYFLILSTLMQLVVNHKCAAQTPSVAVNEFRKGNMGFVARLCHSVLIIEGVGPRVDTVMNTVSRASLKRQLQRIWKYIPKSELLNGHIEQEGATKVLLVMKAFNARGELESESALLFEFILEKSVAKLARIQLAG